MFRQKTGMRNQTVIRLHRAPSELATEDPSRKRKEMSNRDNFTLFADSQVQGTQFGAVAEAAAAVHLAGRHIGGVRRIKVVRSALHASAGPGTILGKSGCTGLSRKFHSPGVTTEGTASVALRRDPSQPSPAEREAGPDSSFSHSGGKVPGSSATPFSLPSGPPQRLFQGPPAKSKFLAAASIQNAG